MSINLKNPEAERLLKELAASTGESLTAAATVAFQERLERLKQETAARRRSALLNLQDLIAEARQAQPLDKRPLKVITDELWGD